MGVASGASSSGAGIVMLCDVDLDMPDGARAHTVEVARGFARAGLDVHLIAPGSDPRVPAVDFVPVDGHEHQRLRLVVGISRQTIKTLWRERQRTRRFYVRHKWTTMPSTVAARLLGYRVVTEVNDLPYGPGFQGEIRPEVDYFKRSVTMLMGRLSHRVVAGTSQMRDVLMREFRVPGERIAVVPIGVDADYFGGLDRAAGIARAGLDPSGRYVLFMGQFQPWVDFDTLLGAFAIVARRDPRARLLLLGDGHQREHVDATIAALDIADAVIRTGYVRDRAAVRDLLAAATVVVASHRGEYLDRIGMNATKIAEYLASGRAVVAKDVAGLRQMIEDTGAGTVTPGDPAAMAAAIESLLDPTRADAVGAVGRELALSRYSWDSTIRQTLALF